jgi:glycosyltransferase involved in cell wall biosynthesis
LVPSLSIVLPVYNAEAMLAEQVCRLLEVLPDLAERFEILIVDDGSTDHTSEIAADLVQQFPQLRCIRQGRRRGAAAAIQAGMAETTGEFVLVQDVHEPISPRSLRRLWELRHDEDLVLARTEPQIKPLDASLLTKLMNWGRGVERAASAERAPASGTQLIRRSAVQELEANPSLQHLRLARAHGAEKLARIVPRRKGTGLMTHLRDFALGE